MELSSKSSIDRSYGYEYIEVPYIGLGYMYNTFLSLNRSETSPLNNFFLLVQNIYLIYRKTKTYWINFTYFHNPNFLLTFQGILKLPHFSFKFILKYFVNKFAY